MKNHGYIKGGRVPALLDRGLSISTKIPWAPRIKPPDLNALQPGFYKLEIFTTNYCSYHYIYEIKIISPVSSNTPLNQ